MMISHTIRNQLNNQSGSAMIITILVIATMVGITLAFSEDTSVEINLAGYARDRYRAYLGAHSGVQLALAAIALDPNGQVDTLREDWSTIFTAAFPGGLPEDVSISGQVIDESGKFNLNFLLKADGEIDGEREQQLYRLFQVLQLDEERAAPILDWLDGDDVERMNGAENAYYRSLEIPYFSSNGPFITTAQILMVKGMKGLNLQDYITVYSDGLVNINTASKEVLRCLSAKIDDSLAESVIAFRTEQDFLSVDDLKNVSGMSSAVFNEIKKWLTVKSNAFSMKVEGQFRDTKAGIKAVAIRKEDETSLVYWRVD